jgi:hypothetical protein
MASAIAINADGVAISGNAGKIVCFLSLRPAPDMTHYIGSLYLFGLDDAGVRVYVACPLTTPEIVGTAIETAGYGGYYNGGVGVTADIDSVAKTVLVTILNPDGSAMWQKTLTPVGGLFYVKSDPAVVNTAPV